MDALNLQSNAIPHYSRSRQQRAEQNNEGHSVIATSLSAPGGFNAASGTGRNPSHWQHLLVAILFLGTVLFALIYGEQQLLRAGTPVPFTAAAKSSTAQPTTPTLNFQAWQAGQRVCRLPKDEPCHAHFRTHINLPNGNQSVRQAILVPRFVGSLQIQLNGVRIAEFGSIAPPVKHLLFSPAYTELPSQLLRVGYNELIFTITGANGRYFRLLPPMTGTAAALAPTARAASLLAHDLLVISCGIYLVLGVLAIFLHRLAAGGALCLWFAGIAVAALVRASFFLVHSQSFAGLWSALYFQSSLLLSVCIFCFATHLNTGAWHRRHAWLAGGYSMLAAILALYAVRNPVPGELQANLVVQLAILPLSLLALYQLVKYFQRAPSIANVWVVGLFVASLVLVAHDLWPTFAGGHFVTLQLSTLAPVFLVIAFCILLVQRVAESTRGVETERKRIMRDMHDGVGGRLAGLVMYARRKQEPELAAQLESSLDDLRLIIESLDDSHSGLLRDLLQRFAERSEFTLTGAGLQSSWRGLLSVPRWRTSAEWQLNLLRILQEALYNAVRHSGASSICFQVESTPDLVTLSIRDNGCGLADNAPGRGLHNMQDRARIMGWSFEIGNVVDDPDRPGTRVTLRLSRPPINMGVV